MNRLKLGIILVSLFISTYIVAQTDTIVINNQILLVKYTSGYGVCNDPDVSMRFYQMLSSGKLKKFDEMEKFSYACDSNSAALELGTYIVSDSTITLYTYWSKISDQLASPFGARKKEYVIDKNGNVKLKSSQLYAEVIMNGFGSMYYLFEKPKNKEEQKEFRAYIDGMQKVFDAKFVFGKQSDDLLNEVRLIFKEDMKKHTAIWNVMKKNNPHWELKK